EDVPELVELIALLTRPGPHVAHRRPEGKGTVTHGDAEWVHAPTLQVPEDGLPALGALPVAVLDRDQFLRARCSAPAVLPRGDGPGVAARRRPLERTPVACIHTY